MEKRPLDVEWDRDTPALDLVFEFDGRRIGKNFNLIKSKTDYVEITLLASKTLKNAFLGYGGL
jgi:hypothetical protein